MGRIFIDATSDAKDETNEEGNPQVCCTIFGVVVGPKTLSTGRRKEEDGEEIKQIQGEQEK